MARSQPRGPHGSQRHDPSRRRLLGRGLLAGVVLASAIGSCEMPKPKIPSIGHAPVVGWPAEAAVDGGGQAPR